MKRLTITIMVTLAMTFAANAQSGMFVGGGLNYTSSDDDFGNGNENGVSNFVFTPMVGKMLNDNMGAGLKLSYTSYTNTNKNVNKNTNITTENKITTSSIGAGVFGRKYFNISEMFKPVIQLDAGFLSGTSESSTTINGVKTSTDADLSGISVNLRPSFAMFMSPKWSMEFSYGGIIYSSFTTKPNVPNATETSDSNFNFDFNANSFGFGIVYYFGG